MNNVIKVDFVTGKKRLNNPVIKEAVTVHSAFIGNDFELTDKQPELSERVERIKNSIRRINQLMEELKQGK